MFGQKVLRIRYFEEKSFRTKIGVQKNFLQILCKKIRSKKVFGPKNLYSKNTLDQKRIWDPKNLG